MTVETNTQEAAIQEVIGQFVTGWNIHNAKALSAVFTDDADFTNVMGRKAHGREAIETFHVPLFAGVFSNSVLTPTETSIRFITSDIAAADFRWSMQGATDGAGNPWPDRKGLINLLLTRKDNRWFILIMHNMELHAKPVTASPSS